MNWHCAVIPGRATRSADSYPKVGLITGTGSYIRETSAERPVKSTETYAGGKRHYTQSSADTVGHSFPRVSAVRTYCSTATMNSNSVAVGCYYLR